MAKKKQKKMSFRGKVKKDNKNHENSGGKFSVLNLPEGVELYKPKMGNRDTFDILPYIVSTSKHPDKYQFDNDGEKETIAHKGDIWYKRPYKVHKDIGANDQTVVCLESFGKPCPICEYKKAQADKGIEWEELKIYKPKDRVLYIIKPIKIKNTKDTFYVFDISFWLFQKQLNEETDEDEEYEDFPLLEGGYSLRVRWVEGSMSKKGSEYCEASRIDFDQRKKDYDSDILDEVPDLDSCLKEMSYDKLKALFFEEDIDEDEEDEKSFKDEDETSKKKTSKKKTKKEPEPEEDEEPGFDWDGLKEMDTDELSDVCELYDIDAEKIVDDEEDEDEANNLLRKAIAEEVGIKVPKEKKKTAKKEKKETKKPSKKSSKKPKCPEDNMEFGVDTDTFEVCDDCKLLEACIKKNEED